MAEFQDFLFPKKNRPPGTFPKKTAGLIALSDVLVPIWLAVLHGMYYVLVRTRCKVACDFGWPKRLSAQHFPSTNRRPALLNHRGAAVQKS